MKKSYLEDLTDIIDIHGIKQHYTTVLTMLYDTEFACVLDEDINRIIDAKNLRTELHGPVIRPISVLEVMIALAKRCHEDIMYGYSFDGVSSSTAYWFWVMMKNCGLSELSNSKYPGDICEEFYSIIDPLMKRTYNFNGSGGFFPLHHPEIDQRYNELWYQMNAYLMENYPF